MERQRHTHMHRHYDGTEHTHEHTHDDYDHDHEHDDAFRPYGDWIRRDGAVLRLTGGALSIVFADRQSIGGRLLKS